MSSIADAGGLEPPSHHYVLGMRLDYLPVERFVGEFASLAEDGRSVYCCVPDVYQCTICHDEESHRKIVNEADYVFSDSTVLQTIRGIRYGVPPVKPLLGSDLMLELCREAAGRGIPVALVGGRSDEVLEQIKRALLEQMPRLKIAYGYSPPFRALTEDEENAMIAGLTRSGAKLVFVGIGCPKQERWMGTYKDKLNAALIGVGAAFDTIGGLVPSSPPYVHRLGLEWLFRLCREPRRLYKRYLGAAPRFLWLMFCDWLASAFQRPRAGTP
ncbi:MAG: WecB/TagA/CpsF family glycosyltransferase [Pseudomonadota bacterium]